MITTSEWAMPVPEIQILAALISTLPKHPLRTPKIPGTGGADLAGILERQVQNKMWLRQETSKINRRLWVVRVRNLAVLTSGEDLRE
jgi:hypothetical protein